MKLPIHRRINQEFVAPIPENERQTTLDVLRGVALFGVLWINLLTGFRISLFEHLFTFHTHPGMVPGITEAGGLPKPVVVGRLKRAGRVQKKLCRISRQNIRLDQGTRKNLIAAKSEIDELFKILTG